MPQQIHAIYTFLASVTKFIYSRNRTIAHNLCYSISSRSMVRIAAMHLYNRSAEVNLRFWSIRCRERFLHKTSMFGSEW